MEQLKITISSEEMNIREKICEYLGSNAIKVNVYLSGKTFYATIVYRDFKPMREVKRTIEDMHPDIYVQDIDRLFSQEAKSQALWDFYNRDETIYIKCGENEARPISFILLIEEELRHKTIA